MYEKADAFEDAAKIYASLGNYQKAIQLYNEAGKTDKANELQAKANPQAAAGKSAAGAAAAGVLELDPGMEVAAGQYLDSKQLRSEERRGGKEWRRGG